MSSRVGTTAGRLSSVSSSLARCRVSFSRMAVTATSAPFRACLISHQPRFVQWMQRCDSACTIRRQVPASRGRSTPTQHSLRASRARRMCSRLARRLRSRRSHCRCGGRSMLISVIVSSGDEPDGAGWRSGDPGRWAAAARSAASGVERVRGDGPAGPVRGGGRRQGRGVAGREQHAEALVCPPASFLWPPFRSMSLSPVSFSLPGYVRPRADSGRCAGPAGQWRVSRSGAVRRAACRSRQAEKAYRSPMSVSALDTRSPGERTG